MLRFDDLPGLFQAADEAAVAGQRAYLRGHGLRLVLAVVAAACAAVSFRVGAARTDLAAVATALTFVVILTLDIGLLSSRPNRTWHEGRALAEAARAVAWKYAVCGAPFEHTLSESDADGRLIDRIRQLQCSFPEVQLQPTTSAAISERMRALRQSSFAERRQEYLEQRIHGQQCWYAAKSTRHRYRGRVLGMTALIFEIAGVSAALAKAFGAINFDLAGVVAASIAGLAAWSSARHDSRVSNLYAVTSNELALIAETLRHTDENHWGSAVADAEKAVSREHVLWRTSHVE
ncbi:DUF4231 domain-containing protein [Nocardia spumae]|uniref:DUF4231 domain-containing protein n=1 Tax=Nocardia spumae TaxID=2887190 RepID=UPI001D13C9C7|nr:DUF4231 domain-containing protein [Nocardia spumae]